MAVEEYTLIITEAGSAVPADQSVTLAKHSNFNAYSVLGRNAGTSGTPAYESCTTYGFDWLTATDAADALSKLGLTFPLVTSSIADGAITLAKLANLSAYSIIGRNDGASGVPVAEPCTSFGFDLLTSSNASDARSKIGVSLPLSVSNGGSGTTSLSGIVIGNGTSPFSTVTAPSGTIVGTSDTQTLTNKTIDGSLNTLSNLPASGVVGVLPVANGGTGSSDGFSTNKATIVDADKFTILDSAASDDPKHVLWSLVKSTLKTYLDTLYVALTGNQSVAGNKDLTGETTLSGGLKRPTTTVTASPHGATISDNFILVDDDTVGGVVTVNLPAAATAGDGAELSIKKLGTTGNVTIDGDGAETIDGAATLVLTTQYECKTIVSDGSDWYIKD